MTVEEQGKPATPKPAVKVAEKPVAEISKPEPVAQVPSISRIVLYTTGQGTVRPAIITGLLEDGDVQLTVFNSEGAVPTEASFSEESIAGCWNWPAKV